MKLTWPKADKCKPAGTLKEYQNCNVAMPITTPGVKTGAIITAYKIVRLRPLRLLMRMAPAVPMGTANSTTTTATMIVCITPPFQPHRLSMANRSGKNRKVNPCHGKGEGSFGLLLNAAPTITKSGSMRYTKNQIP